MSNRTKSAHINRLVFIQNMYECKLINFQTYADPPAISPEQNRPKDDKAFDNTAFVDYEEPLSIKTEYYQLNDVLEPNESGNTV